VGSDGAFDGLGSPSYNLFDGHEPIGRSLNGLNNDTLTTTLDFLEHFIAVGIQALF